PVPGPLLTMGVGGRRLFRSKPRMGVHHADSTGLPSSRRPAWHRRLIPKPKIESGSSPIAKRDFAAGPPSDASMRTEALALAPLFNRHSCAPTHDGGGGGRRADWPGAHR